MAFDGDLPHVANVLKESELERELATGGARLAIGGVLAVGAA